MPGTPDMTGKPLRAIAVKLRMIIEVKKQALTAYYTVLFREGIVHSVANHIQYRLHIINGTERIAFYRKLVLLQVIPHYLRKAGPQGDYTGAVVQLKIKGGIIQYGS